MLHDRGRINNSENFFSLNDKLARIYPTNKQWSSPAKSSASSYRKPGKLLAWLVYGHFHIAEVLREGCPGMRGVLYGRTYNREVKRNKISGRHPSFL